jgi:hypothetical protein
MDHRPKSTAKDSMPEVDKDKTISYLKKASSTPSNELFTTKQSPEVENLVDGFRKALYEDELEYSKSGKQHKLREEGIKIQKLEHELAILKIDGKMREDFAHWIFCLVALWLALTIIIVVACGKGFLRLGDAVVIAFITTTTTAVILLLHFVLNYLFGKGSDAKKN